jgi:DNA-binding transcriptional LysR family regulator
MEHSVHQSDNNAMTLEQLRIFVKVVQASSFTLAAEMLETQKSYVSRVVAQLEADLGVKLLERTTRKIAITEIGREVYERAVGILGAVEDTGRLVAHSQGEPRGLLRLTCGVEFGMLAVNRWVEAYLATYPQASVEVEYTSRVLDLVHEGFDLAIRVGPVQESQLVARKLGELDYGLFACSRYVARQGLPATPAELRQHSLVMFTGGSHRRGWTLVRGDADPKDSVRVEGPARLRVNNSFAVRDALLASLGIGLLPLLIAHEHLAAQRLVPVLPGWQQVAAPVYAVYPSNRYLSPKVRALVDLAADRFPQDNAQARAVAVAACRPGRPRRGRAGAAVSKARA